MTWPLEPACDLPVHRPFDGRGGPLSYELLLLVNKPGFLKKRPLGGWRINRRNTEDV